MNFTTGECKPNKVVFLKNWGKLWKKLGFCFQIDFKFLFYVKETGNWSEDVIN